MGRLAADDMAAHCIDLDVALTWHLRSNHYPPVPLFMVPVAKAAVEAGRDEDWDRLVELPKGCTVHQEVHATYDNRLSDDCELEPAVTWRNGSTSVPAGDIVESFHLDSFCQ